MEDYCCLCAGLCFLGLDLSRHWHCCGADSSGRHVRIALPGRGYGYARLLCSDGTPHSFFRAAAGHMAAVGILVLMGGNLTLSYAEQIVPTGLAALLIAVTPLWFLVLDSLLLGDHHISGRGKIGLAIGIAGVVVLIWPDLRHSDALGHRELWWTLALQLGSFSWALGSVLSKKWQTAAVDPFSSTAWQGIFAGIANLVFALILQRHSHLAWTLL